MRLLAWLGQFLCRSEQTPPVEVITRDYEWMQEMWCAECVGTIIHRFIEWIEPRSVRVTTKECLHCALETEVAREEASP